MAKKLLSILLCWTFAFLAVWPAAESRAANESVTAAVDNLNIRSGPGLSFDVVSKVDKGTSLTTVSEKGDWIQIRLSNGKLGWTANWLVNKPVSSYAEVKEDKLRIRSGPGTEYKISGYLKKGQQVAILEESNKWSKISSDTGTGWVSSDFLTKIDRSGGIGATKETKSSPNSKALTVNADSLNVRTKPSLTSPIAGKLPKGASVEVFSEKNGWTEISFSGGKGWVSSSFLSTPSSQVGNKVPSSGKTPSGSISGMVTVGALYVRSTSSLEGKIVGTVKKGDRFNITEEYNNWAKIELKSGKSGWVAGWYLEKTAGGNGSKPEQEVKTSKVTILHNGTNIRKSPSTESNVVFRANKGDSFQVKKISGTWYEIELKGGNSGFVAGWIVEVNGTAPQIGKPGGEAYLKDKIIVLDAGHGGIDNGTTGARRTLEKNLTLRTANLLYDKLTASGAKVIMSRTYDTYISLASRVSPAHYHGADAFISIHYDSNGDRSVKGMTSYYYHSYQKGLASTLHNSLFNQTKIKDRGVRFGDFHVLRENRQPSALLELGYLSNPQEEMTMNSAPFQEAAASGIFYGLARYFKGE